MHLCFSRTQLFADHQSFLWDGFFSFYIHQPERRNVGKIQFAYDVICFWKKLLLQFISQSIKKCAFYIQLEVTVRNPQQLFLSFALNVLGETQMCCYIDTIAFLIYIDPGALLGEAHRKREGEQKWIKSFPFDNNALLTMSITAVPSLVSPHMIYGSGRRGIESFVADGKFTGLLMWIKLIFYCQFILLLSF